MFELLRRLARESYPWDADLVRRRAKERGLSRKQTNQSLALWHRARFARSYIRNRRGKAWTPRDYQKISLESHALRKVHCDGRDVGKTSEIELVTAWAMVARPDTEMLIATQCDNHLFPLMNRLLRQFTANPHFAPSLVECRQTPSWFLRFSNGFVLWGRIAGPRGQNFQGLHVDWQIVDEAQEMTETSWGELYQALNGGGRRWVYGVPNGLRNTFHRMTQAPDTEQYNWPSSLNPEFTAEKDAELARLYGGRQSPGYIHRVLGQHGAPAHGVFDLDHYLACVDAGIDFTSITLTEDDDFEVPTDLREGNYYLGADLGYARDPSEFVVYKTDGPHLINTLRLHLQGVNYHRQQEIIAALDHAYNFRGIGIDAGNNGRAVAHNLMVDNEDSGDKIHAYEFGAKIDIGRLPNGDPDRRHMKIFMTDLLLRRMAERTIVFPRLPDREAQYAAHTYRVGANGRIVYEKGDDHIIDADRCAVLRHFLDTHEREEPVNLGSPVETF